ncbi:hypothetical protein AAMO2058_000110100 [Amorphochlora amoebiformis]
MGPSSALTLPLVATALVLLLYSAEGPYHVTSRYPTIRPHVQAVYTRLRAIDLNGKGNSFFFGPQSSQVCAWSGACIISGSFSLYSHINLVVGHRLAEPLRGMCRMSPMSVTKLAGTLREFLVDSGVLTSGECKSRGVTQATSPRKGEQCMISGTEIKVGESTSLYDLMGPLVVNEDGTVGYLKNWREMSEPEKRTTLRLLTRRNRIRMANLTGDASKLNDDEMRRLKQKQNADGDP